MNNVPRVALFFRRLLALFLLVCAPARADIAGYWRLTDALAEPSKTLPTAAPLHRVVLFALEVGPDGSLRAPASPDSPALTPERLRQLINHQPSPSTSLPKSPRQWEIAVKLEGKAAWQAVFQQPQAAALLRREMLEWLNSVPELSAVHIDFEVFELLDDPVAQNSFVQFNQWLAQLRRDLLAMNPPRHLSGFWSSGTVLFNQENARAMHWWAVQTYDAHWPDSPRTGPIVTNRADNAAHIARQVRRLKDLGVPVSRMALALPLYGYRWPVRGTEASPNASTAPAALTQGPGSDLLYRDAIRSLGHATLRRDPELSPWFVRSEGQTTYQAWFEDPKSLTAKLSRWRMQGFLPPIFFALGDDDHRVIVPMNTWWNQGNRKLN